MRSSLVIAAAVGASLLCLPASAGATLARAGGAQDLTLTPAVRVSLTDAAAQLERLPDSAYIGLAPGTAYYAFDRTTSTYWAGASLIPSPHSLEAQVSVQDDGGYIIFDRSTKGGWQLHDTGLAGTAGSRCAVTIPAAVLGVWHWPAGTCRAPIGPTPAPVPVETTPFAAAKQKWEQGAQASSAAEGGYLLAAASDLAGVTGSQRTADAAAASTLRGLAKLPDADLTAAQETELADDVLSLDAFFDTTGLYGLSPPSASVAAFVAVLRREALLGTLAAVPATPPIAGAVVTCPVLSSLAVNSAFGCRIASTAGAQYVVIGEIESAHAMSYAVNIVQGAPVFACSGLLDAAEQRVLDRLGGHCS